ncbi:hypothetical protein AB0O01_34975 [Streptomyces sp. NPDC093252]|uniref:hypothetical protein n=1 Tax=Streptomyces sp. NPDC093252 TaxID=3154980 RepID=UPI003412D144
MPRFQVRTRMSWSFSAQAGIGRPHRTPTAVRLARVGAVRALALRAARGDTGPVRHRLPWPWSRLRRR